MRTVTLLHRSAWKALHSVDDLWTQASQKAGELLLGTASIQRDLQVEPFVVAPGYEVMLQRLVAALAHHEGIDGLHRGFEPWEARTFGPYDGLKRRGDKTLRDLARAQAVEPSAVEGILERLQRLFLVS